MHKRSAFINKNSAMIKFTLYFYRVSAVKSVSENFREAN